jgi:hypothetical protein
MTPEISSGILNRSVHEVEEALHTGLQNLPALEDLRRRSNGQQRPDFNPSLYGVTRG